jgi:antitoxin component of MazEF toxin-antitoxin module
MVTALPPDWMRAFKLTAGDEIDVLYNSIIIIKPKGIHLDPDFLKKEFALIMELEQQSKDARWRKEAEK